MGAIVLYDLMYETKTSEKLQVYFILIVHGLTLVMQVTVLIFHGRIFQMMTTFYRMQRVISKFYQPTKYNSF
jgi:hypothetical protein